MPGHAHSINTSVNNTDDRSNKPKMKKTYIFRRLWKYLYRFKWLLLTVFVLTIASNVFALFGPLLSGYAIDSIGVKQGSVNFERMFYYAFLMLAFYVLSSFFGWIISVLMIKLSRNVTYQMRKDAFDNLVSLPISFFDAHQAGEIISIISYDLDTVNTSLASDFVQIGTSIITVVGSFIMMLTISPKLVLVFLITIPISILSAKWRAKKVRALYRKRSIKLGELNGYIEEIITGLKTIKAYHQEKTMIGRFDKKNNEAVGAYYNADYYGSMMGPLMGFINNLSLALVSVFGSVLYMFGSLSLGNISSFVLYSRKFSGPINEFANIINELQSAFAAAERVFALIDQPSEPADSENSRELQQVIGDVSVNNVSFGYEPGKQVIKKFNLNVKPSQVIAIVGPTGAGKTTIINLLMRFYDIKRGTIYVDGHNIKHITRKSLRFSYTMVLQDTWLFHGTIFENIAYGKENVTFDEVVKVARAAKIHDFIMSLPNGYDTVLSDNAVNISKGQKQLITIARAMLLDSPMLILDEATSSVDTQTEQQIQSAMLQLMKNRTTFVIAHRLSTIQNADLILVVNNGSIAEQGTHRELMKEKGLYFKMYHSQQL
ncbi:MAG: ABC transporter ATP-binding protein [Clostridiaceae bacterium]|nr:ABC transporter ATP-binding protein [Clostridiaceae bacterium]